MSGRPARLIRLAGRSVSFVMAAAAEYGPHLQRLFVPLMTGVGPVEAGVRHGAAELGRIGDWTACVPIIDERPAAAVDLLGQALSSGAIRLPAR